MTMMEALEEAIGAAELMVRPVSWRGAAKGLTYDDQDRTWIFRDYSPQEGICSYQVARARNPTAAETEEEWEVVPKAVLHSEAQSIIDRGEGEKELDRRRIRDEVRVPDQ